MYSKTHKKAINVETDVRSSCESELKGAKNVKPGVDLLTDAVTFMVT